MFVEIIGVIFFSPSANTNDRFTANDDGDGDGAITSLSSVQTPLRRSNQICWVENKVVAHRD